MLNALGDTDHTRFLTPADVKQENTDLSGHFVGIGVQVNFKNGRPVVVAPIPNSPALRAGLRAGDVILAVDNKDTAQMNPTDLAASIRGAAGTSVQLLILRPGNQTTLNVTVQRAAIVQPAVETNKPAVADRNSRSLNRRRLSSGSAVRSWVKISNPIRTVPITIATAASRPTTASTSRRRSDHRGRVAGGVMRRP